MSGRTPAATSALSAERRKADANAEATLLRTMIAANPYRDLLWPIEADVVRVALGNDQIRSTLGRLAASVREPSRWGLSLRAPSKEEHLLLSYLEYVAFASPAFLASVGEWPLGRRHG